MPSVRHVAGVIGTGVFTIAIHHLISICRLQMQVQVNNGLYDVQVLDAANITAAAAGGDNSSCRCVRSYIKVELQVSGSTQHVTCLFVTALLQLHC